MKKKKQGDKKPRPAADLVDDPFGLEEATREQAALWLDQQRRPVGLKAESIKRGKAKPPAKENDDDEDEFVSLTVRLEKTPKHAFAQFIEYYIQNPQNPISAMKKAGIFRLSRKRRWEELKNHPEFLAAVAERRSEIVRNLKIDTDSIAAEYKAIAFQTISSFYEETPDGLSAKALTDIDPVVIKDVVETETGSDEYGRRKKKRKYVFHDKMAALQALRDLLGLDAPRKTASVMGIGGIGGTADDIEREVSGFLGQLIQGDAGHGPKAADRPPNEDDVPVVP